MLSLIFSFVFATDRRRTVPSRSHPCSFIKASDPCVFLSFLLIELHPSVVILEAKKEGDAGAVETRRLLRPRLFSIGSKHKLNKLGLTSGCSFVDPYKDLHFRKSASRRRQGLSEPEPPAHSQLRPSTSFPSFPFSLAVTPSSRSPPSDGESSLPPLLHSESAPSLRSDFHGSHGKRPRQRSSQQDGLLLCGCGDLQQ